MCIFMISKIYTLNAYQSCWKVYPFFQISAILIPFPLYARTSPVREKRPFLRMFLYEHGVHLSMAVAPPPPPGYVLKSTTELPLTCISHKSEILFCVKLIIVRTLLFILMQKVLHRITDFSFLLTVNFWYSTCMSMWQWKGFIFL